MSSSVFELGKTATSELKNLWTQKLKNLNYHLDMHKFILREV